MDQAMVEGRFEWTSIKTGRSHNGYYLRMSPQSSNVRWRRWTWAYHVKLSTGLQDCCPRRINGELLPKATTSSRYLLSPALYSKYLPGLELPEAPLREGKERYNGRECKSVGARGKSDHFVYLWYLTHCCVLWLEPRMTTVMVISEEATSWSVGWPPKSSRTLGPLGRGGRGVIPSTLWTQSCCITMF